MSETMIQTVKSIRDYAGIPCQQTAEFESVVRPFLLLHQFTHIVEIGTGRGGFTKFLRDTLPDASIHTWDIVQHLSDDQLRTIRATYHPVDAITDSFLAATIRLANRLLVICDGGNKIAEVRHVAPLLRRGDCVIAHDYAVSQEEFKATYKGRIWNWLEITDADIAATLRAYSLNPYHPELREAMWGCWIKDI